MINKKALDSPKKRKPTVFKMTRLERFEKKISKDESGCWNWNGATSPNGYANFWGKDSYMSGHRWSYEYFVGPIPTGLTIDPLCRNRRCVNPKHLESVTSRENTLRGEGLAAKNARKTHCKYGHEFTNENTYLRLGKERRCRECNRRLDREYKARVATKALEKVGGK